MRLSPRLEKSFFHLASTLYRWGIGRVPGVRVAYAYLHRLLVPGEEREVLVHGMRMRVDMRDRVIATHLVADRIWEPDETALFLAQLREGMCVFDVGANIGYYTLLAARAVGPSGRVYAFEPEPGNYDLLSRNVAANGFTNVRALRLGVSRSRGSAHLYLDDANYGAHSLQEGAVQDSTGRSTEIETVCLDDFADEAVAFTKGIFVKIDVQGSEALVVEGARRLLARPGVVMLLEFWPEALTCSSVDAGEFLRSLEQSGFQIREVGSGEAEPRVLGSRDVLEVCRTGPEPWMNLLLTKTQLGSTAEGTGYRG